MQKRTLLALSVASGAPLVLAAAHAGSATAGAEAARPASSQTAPSAADAAPALPSAANAPAVVDAANAFLATLSDQQRSVARIALTPGNAARWSNFPAGFAPRNGVYFRDLNADQTAAALKVARLALSPEGFARYQEIRATDDYFAKHDTGPGGGRRPGGRGPGGPGGPPPGGGFGGPGGALFGAGNYMIAFLGQPSATTPWLLQLGGHHIAFNIYYKGTAGAATPYFVGVQPNTWKDAAGKEHPRLRRCATPCTGWSTP